MLKYKLAHLALVLAILANFLYSPRVAFLLWAASMLPFIFPHPKFHRAGFWLHSALGAVIFLVRF